ncbi:MAG TPA: hypothetical protein VHY75_07105 [Steroidobacteraceae bacterium]|nr:hypothetical protein [Steroidobacteraceae bacterium]
MDMYFFDPLLPQSRRLRCAALMLAAFFAQPSAAGSPFDLAGPTLEVTVTRGGTTLPAAEVPNLAPDDKIWIRVNLPPSESAHYKLVSAFLSGSTNPPPESWFYQCKTWTPKCAMDGLTVTVPKDAEQMLVFLAPEAGGDFKTLVGAVRGRPGAFVRTSQDLNQAALDRSRLERYLASIRALNDSDPEKLSQVAPLLARSLAIKVDQKCLDRIPELQAPCLMDGQESLILNDGHSTSIVEALTSGPGSDLAMEASYTPQLSYGYYSPYIASVLDIAKILDSFHTAQYQYIPALASPHGNELALTLNAAPSFHNPKSVLVVAMPAIEQAQLPPLHAVDPKEIYCARKTQLVLPVEGAPLVFSTSYAHDLTLSLAGSGGKSLQLPVTADPAQGGFVVDTSSLGSVVLGDSVEATLRGYWGFDPYRGPTFRLRNARASAWQLAAGDEAALIVGRQDTVHLRADDVSCVDSIMLKDPAGKELKAEWKRSKPDEVEVKLPLQESQPGAMTLLVAQYGVPKPQPLSVQSFAEPGRFDGFEIHAGDSQGTLTGSRLDEVASLSLKNVVFTPGELSTHPGGDSLPMSAKDGESTEWRPEHAVTAKVTLKDGRVMSVPATLDAARPKAALIGKSVQASALSGDSNIQLADPSELPQDAVLVFSIRAQVPATFGRDESVDVATVDDAFDASLSLTNGGLALENSRVAVATFSPAKAFGASAYGPLKYRVNSKGVAGDWQPLANLVRLPMLKALDCPATPELACKLTGSSLYLIDSVSADAQFTKPVVVPDGFLGEGMPVPHPLNGRLYLKLRDNPLVVNPTALTVQSIPPAPAETERAQVRQSALNSDSPAARSDGAPATTPPSPPPAKPMPSAPNAPSPTGAPSPAGAPPTGAPAPKSAPPPTGGPAPNSAPPPTGAPPSTGAPAPTSAPSPASAPSPTTVSPPASTPPPAPASVPTAAGAAT